MGSQADALCPVCLMGSALGEPLDGDSDAPSSLTPPGAALRLPEPPAKLRYFGDYELIGELARGGMGIVYLARQSSLDRLVAVKLLLFGGFSSPAFVDRFRIEATAAARLQHPGIVGIFEIGQHEGQHFFSMEYVAGENLAHRVQRRPLSPRDAAALIAEVAEAVHHAHQHGVLHRDLKPANVLIDVSGHPRVTDFGLAKRLDRESELTATGEVLGSPSFMAPEQVRADAAAVGVPADVYGLGAMLYHALTGRPPFQASTVAATLSLVIHEDPVRPRLLNPSTPRDLETICLKCLSKAPIERYRDAAALRDDLRRFRDGEPIQARPVGRPERMWRWARRHPAAAGLIAAAGLLMLTLVGGGWLYGRQRELARRRETALRAESERQRYAISINLAERARSEGDFSQADKLLNGLAPRVGDPDLRGWEWHHLRHELRGQEMRMLWSGTNEVLALAANPAGDRLAALFAGELRVLDVANGAVLDRWVVPENSTGNRTLLFAPDAAGVIVGGVGGAVLCTSGQAPRSIIEEPANVLALSPDGAQLAFSSVDWERNMDAPVGAGVLNWATGRVLWRMETNGGPAVAWMANPADGSKPELWILGSRGQLTRAPSGEPPQPVWGRRHFTDFAAFSPDRSLVLVDDVRGYFDWFRVREDSGAMASPSNAPRHRIPWSVTRPALAFNAAGDRVAMKHGADGRISVCDAATGEVLDRYPGHRGELSGLAFLGGTALLASASRDGTIRIWDTSKPPGNFRIANDLLSFGLPRPLFSPDSKFVSFVVNGAFPKIRSVNVRLADMSIMATFSGCPVVFSPDSKDLLYWKSPKMYGRLNENSQEKHDHIRLAYGSSIGGDVLSRDGSLVVYRDEIGAMYVTTISNQVAPRKISPDASPPVMSNKKPIFATATAGGVSLWNPRSEKLELILQKDALAFSFSPDDNYIGIGDIGGTIYIIELIQNKIKCELSGHGGEVNSLAFSPDGRSLASAAEDRMLRIWNIEDGGLLFSRRYSNDIHWIQFSPNGQWLVLGWVGAYEFLSATRPQIEGSVQSSLGLWDNLVRATKVPTASINK